MEEKEFKAFAAGWKKQAKFSEEKVAELCEAANGRYNKRLAKGYAACGKSQTCKNKLILDLAKARQQKAFRAAQSIKLCNIECIGLEVEKERLACEEACKSTWFEKIVGYRYIERKSKKQFPSLFK